MSSPEPVRSLGELAALDPATRDARELEWFARVRTGDAQAFEALFRAYVDPLCSFAYSYVESESQAQEIVQDLFARFGSGARRSSGRAACGRISTVRRAIAC